MSKPILLTLTWRLEVTRQVLQQGEPHTSLLKSGDPPTQLAPQRTGLVTQVKSRWCVGLKSIENCYVDYVN